MTYALPGMLKTSITATTYIGSTDSPFTRNRAVLDMIKGYFKTVILISHLDSLKDCVDMQINIEKQDGFAHVNI